jgi:hypothetical protein
MAEPRQRRPITIFSVLALIVLLCGVAAVLYFRFFTMDAWINSGHRVPLAPRDSRTAQGAVELAAGPQVVFYESPVGVPQFPGMIDLYIEGQDGTPVRVGLFRGDEGAESYGPRPVLSFTNMSGKPFWQIEVPVNGVYQVYARAEDEFLEDAGEDRIVFNKNPPLFSQLDSRTKTVMIVLLSVTGGIFVGLYILHAVALARRAKSGDATPRTRQVPLVPME